MKMYRLNVSVVSWINGAGLRSSFPDVTAPYDWLGKLSYGLYNTRNTPPPDDLDVGAGGYARLLHGRLGSDQREFRGLTSASVYFLVNDQNEFVGSLATGTPSIVVGDTPPFQADFPLYLGALGAEAISLDPGISLKIRREGTSYNRGELSAQSCGTVPKVVFLPNKGDVKSWQSSAVSQIPYSCFSPPVGQRILANALIKFRAGDAGDYVGVLGVGGPNQLPWV
jgi:hypothetical protein